jgi:ribosomal protein S27AE
MPTANDNSFTDKAYFCPACGTSMVDVQVMAGTTTCGVCAWTGKIEELAAMPFSQEMGSPEQVLHNLALDIRQFLSKDFVMPFLKMLSKWGFTSWPPTPQEAARYMGSVAKSVALGLIQTRQEIEKEKVQR